MAYSRIFNLRSLKIDDAVIRKMVTDVLVLKMCAELFRLVMKRHQHNKKMLNQKNLNFYIPMIPNLIWVIMLYNIKYYYIILIIHSKEPISKYSWISWNLKCFLLKLKRLKKTLNIQKLLHLELESSIKPPFPSEISAKRFWRVLQSKSLFGCKK